MGYYADQYTPRPVTDIFTPKDTDIDRRQCQRVVPMRVLAMGLGRTGTASLREALKILGLTDTYHMLSASVENPPDCLMWRDAFAAKYEGRGKFGRREWDQLLGHCQAVCDWPASAFAKELIEAYPDAKVILSTRNPDSWHASTMGTVWWRVTEPELRWLSYFSWAAAMYQPMLSTFFNTFFEGDFPGKGKAIFERHNNDVRRWANGRVLEYRISDGWGPLCEYLEVPVPDVPFPNGNDSKEFVTRSKRRNRNQMYNVAFRFVILSILILGALMVLRSVAPLGIVFSKLEGSV